MLIDTPVRVATTASRFSPIPVMGGKSFADSDGYVAVLNNGRESLAASIGQARLLKSLFYLGQKFATESVSVGLFDTMLDNSLFPVTIDTLCLEDENRETRRLETKLKRAFEDLPLEDGMNHPAELTIDEAMQSADRQRIYEWLGELVVDIDRPKFAASVLRCLGRRQPGTSAWRLGIVRTALATDDLEIRDAAVQAAESWGDKKVRNVLQNHTETTPWLRDYIEDVIEDIGE